MKYMRLHKSKVDQNEHGFIDGNKRASSNGQKMKRFSEAIQKLLITYKDRKQDSTRDALWSRYRDEDEVESKTKI
ncbi:hypothetical protein Hanom_Chr12g01103391 [Helianthus anomalus]